MAIVGRNLGASALALAALAMAGHAQAQDAAAALKAMTETNLIVFGDMSGGHDVEGKAYVGGNLSGNSTTVGIGNGAQGAAASNRSTLTVGGALTANNVNLNNGSNGGAGSVATNFGATVGGNAQSFNLNAQNANVRVGGSLNSLSVSQGSTVAVGDNLGQANLGQNSVVTVGNNASNINGASGASLQVGGSLSGYANGNGATLQSGLGLDFNAPVVPDLAAETAGLQADLQALSSQLNGLTLLSNLSTVTYSGGRATFNAVDSGEGYALFNVGPSIFSYSEFDYNFGAGAFPVIINVTGAQTYTWLANAVGGNNSSANQRVIWNFADALTVDFQRMVHGSVLAPYATISNNTPIEGSVVAKAFNQGGEVHLGTYNGGDDFLTSAVPEPAAWAMMILGFFGMGAALRRRRALAAA